MKATNMRYKVYRNYIPAINPQYYMRKSRKKEDNFERLMI